MPHQHNGAKGEMELFYENDESASGHRDQTKKITLKALDATTLSLRIEISDSNACNGFTDTMGTAHYKITVDELVALVKKHGKEWHPPPLIPLVIPPQKPLPEKYRKKHPPK